MPTQILLSEQTIRRLIAAYRVAESNKKPSFVFEGVELITGYAYYLLKYWAPKFGVDFDERA